MSEGAVYHFDTETNVATQITIAGDDGAGGAPLCSSDGLLLDGKTLYVVQNFLNRVAVVEMAPDLFSGEVTRYITEPFALNAAIKVPTTVAEFGDSLYAVTAGFAPPAPDFIVRMRK